MSDSVLDGIDLTDNADQSRTRQMNGLAAGGIRHLDVGVEIVSAMETSRRLDLLALGHSNEQPTSVFRQT